MTEKFTNIKNCRLCESYQIKPVMAFGDVALANAYPKELNEEEEKFPLTVMKCANCGHVQLRQTVDPKILFSNYLYASSDSPTLVRHFEQYARDVISEFNLGEYSQVVEVGCNDGILLNQFRSFGVFGNLIGIDPATNITEIAKRKNKLIIYNDFFNLDLAEKIKLAHSKADVIVSNNTFAHIDNLDSITLGIKTLLSDEGVFIFENAYLLDTLKGLYFDQIYHEHLQYYAIAPLQTYLRNRGLEIFKVAYNKIQGGSFRCYVKHVECKKYPIDESVANALFQEKEFGLHNDTCFEDFLDKLFDLRNDIVDFVIEAKTNGKTISCYGCPAKFALFTKFFNLSSNMIDYVVDDSPLKQGRFSPEKKIPIVSKDFFIKNPTDYCIISVWNMADSIIQNNPQYKGRFIIPMPQFIIN